MAKQYKLGIALMGDHVNMIGQIGWEAFFTGWDRNNLERWANEAARNGLIYQSIHSPFGGQHKVSYMWQDREEGKFVTDQLIECVKDCARFDIPVMVIHPFIGFRDHTPTQIGLDNYARVVEVANKLGVKLGFENVEGEEYLVALMEKFWNEPCCGFCLDTGHEQCYNGGKDMMALYGEKLCHTHFNDNLGIILPPDASVDLTWHNDLHLTMGDGIVDWKGVMDRIDASPYEGPLICELTRGNKPGRNDHDGYAAMTMEGFYAFALERARMVRDRKL
ncbi:MAG: sugar phosphate isomerase/epimerase [Clostridia bacterium]|nr:sugar phosphate isomerase/epimerase [Clostridia bacterium]